MFNYTYWGNHTLPALDNMALEEYFLKKSAQDKSAHIRFYDFAKDTVVLGYGQATDAVKKWTHDFTVARRATGGSHVHTGKNSLAYSFVVPRDGSFSNYEDFRAYYAEKVANALQNLGIDAEVDNSASTINHDGKVIASHAITWGVDSALLHGLVHIDPFEMDKVIQRITLGQRKIGGTIYTEETALKQIPAVTQILKNKPNATPEARTTYFKELIGTRILAEITKDYKKDLLSNPLLKKAQTLQQKKHASEIWIKQRNPTFSADEIEEIPGETLNGTLKKGQGYCLYSQVKDKHFKKMATHHNN